MIKSQLILRLAARYKHLVHQDAEIAVNLIVGAMIDALAHGRRIEVRGFGSFALRQRKARVARNPRTGESVNVPLKRRIYFRPTGDLKRRVSAGVVNRSKQRGEGASELNERHDKVAIGKKVGLQDVVSLLETNS